MKKYTFSLGLNDKDSKLQEINTIDAYKTVMNLVWSYFGGWTITEWQGFYTHEDWTTVFEKSLIITTYSDKEYYSFIQDLKRIFNQESIGFEEVETTVKFL